MAEPPPVTNTAFSDDLADKSINDSVKTLDAILNIGHQRSLIVFYDNITQAPVGAKSILWGGHNIIEAIAKVYELPYVEASNETKLQSFLLLTDEGATSDQIAFSKTIGKVIDDLGRSLRLVFMDIQSEFRSKVKELHFTGGSSQIRNFGPYLTQQLEVPCNRFQYLSKFARLSKNINVSPESEAKYSLALSLAIEGLKTPRNPAVNFLKGEFAQQSQAFRVFWKKWRPTITLAASITGIFFVYSTLRHVSTESLDRRTETLMKEQAKSVAKLSRRKASITNIRKFIDNKKSIAKKRLHILSLVQLPSALDVFKKINDALPSKKLTRLSVTHLKIKDNNIAIQGLARRQDIPHIKQALKRISSNQKIKVFNSFEKPASGKAVFAFKFKYNRKKNKL